VKSLISVRQFSAVTGIGYKRSRQLVSSGAIPSKQVGCRRLISTRWLDRWLEEDAASGHGRVTGDGNSPGDPATINLIRADCK